MNAWIPAACQRCNYITCGVIPSSACRIASQVIILCITMKGQKNNMKGRKPIHPRPYPKFRESISPHREELGGRYHRWVRGDFGVTGQLAWACRHPECLLALYEDLTGVNEEGEEMKLEEKDIILLSKAGRLTLVLPGASYEVTPILLIGMADMFVQAIQALEAGNESSPSEFATSPGVGVVEE